MKKFSLFLSLFFVAAFAFGQEKYLDVDPNEQYWQPALYFCSKDKVDVDYLIQQTHSENPNIRINAISVLGVWLLEEKAADDIIQEYNQDLTRYEKSQIIYVVDSIVTNLDDRDAIMNQFLETETDEEIRNFINESLETSQEFRELIAEYKSYEIEDVDRAAFKKEYKKLLNSNGKKGDYGILSHNSIYEDEKDLIKLRTRIAKRQSDEALFDIANVNEIIHLNRLIQNN